MPSLEFTLMVGCPLKCTFCPQDRLRGVYGKNTKYMSLDDFKTILSKIPNHVRIDFSGMAEPWTNPDATAICEAGGTAPIMKPTCVRSSLLACRACCEAFRS